MSEPPFSCAQNDNDNEETSYERHIGRTVGAVALGDRDGTDSLLSYARELHPHGALSGGDGAL